MKKLSFPTKTEKEKMKLLLPIETCEVIMPEITFDPYNNIVEILNRHGSKCSDEEIISRAYVQLAEVDWDILWNDCVLEG